MSTKSKKFTAESTLSEVAKHYGLENSLVERAVAMGLEALQKELQNSINEILVQEVCTLSNDEGLVQMIRKALKKDVAKNLPDLIDKAMKRVVIYCEEP